MDITKYTNLGGRKNNEDFCDYVIIEDKTCLVLCDGLGGHSHGEVASQEVTRYIIDSFIKKPIVSEGNLSHIVQKSQEYLLNMQNSVAKLKEMKTTLTCVFISSNRIICAHVGDSRIYLFRKNKMIYESEDHSVPYALYKSNRIKKKEIRGHDDSNVVVRAMGKVWNQPEYTLRSFERRGNESILMCTDGFWEYLIEKDMIRTLKKSDNSKEWLYKMVSLMQQNIDEANHDNYTMVVTRM